jgi:hypothetical protein
MAHRMRIARLRSKVGGINRLSFIWTQGAAGESAGRDGTRPSQTVYSGQFKAEWGQFTLTPFTLWPYVPVCPP